MECERHRDPVVEVYKQHVDRTLLRENLRLSHDQRMRKFLPALCMATHLRGGGAEREGEGVMTTPCFESLLPTRANLIELIAMKRAAGRPKDLEAIAELESLLPGEGCLKRSWVLVLAGSGNPAHPG